MIFTILTRRLKNIINTKQKRAFLKKWSNNNRHNEVVPISQFPLENVDIGKYSYGELNLFAYDRSNLKDKLIIGNFVSISSNVKFFLHENHQTRTFTTFPLKSILLKQPSSNDMV